MTRFEKKREAWRLEAISNVGKQPPTHRRASPKHGTYELQWTMEPWMTLEQLTTLPPDAFFQLTGQVHPLVAARNIETMKREDTIPTPHRWVGGRVHDDDCGCGRCGALGVNGEMR